MKLKLIEKRDEAKNIKSFFWLPSESVNFLPGQYFYYTLPKLNYPDARGSTRHFTISSSPVETRLLRLTTRMNPNSGFKQTLDELPINAEVEGQGPNGTFYFDGSERGQHIFLAGGIGITTFRSMINYSLVNSTPVQIFLFYSCPDEESMAFGEELSKWSKTYGNFVLKKVITGIDGRLTAEKASETLSQYQFDPKKANWWACGSPEFVNGMGNLVSKLHIADNLIHTEKFTGY